MVKKFMICQGDTTTHGGRVLEGSSLFTVEGNPVACVSHQVYCPQCKGTFAIIEGSASANVMGLNVAIEGMETACGAVLIASQRQASVEVDNSAHETVRLTTQRQTRLAEILPETHPSPPSDPFYASPAPFSAASLKEDVVCAHHDQAIDVAQYILQEIRTNSDSVSARQIIALHQKIADIEADIDYMQQRAHNEANSIKKAIYLSQASEYFSSQMNVIAGHKARAMVIWAKEVMQGGLWDHKPLIAHLFPTQGNSTQFYHKYKKYEYYYDIWSNIHYGYLGMYCGFSESELLDGAGLEQVATNVLQMKLVHAKGDVLTDGFRVFDNPSDNLTIVLGIQLYKLFHNPLQLEVDHLMNEIEILPLKVFLAPKSKKVKDTDENAIKLTHRCF